MILKSPGRPLLAGILSAATLLAPVDFPFAGEPVPQEASLQNRSDIVTEKRELSIMPYIKQQAAAQGESVPRMLLDTAKKLEGPAQAGSRYSTTYQASFLRVSPQDQRQIKEILRKGGINDAEIVRATVGAIAVDLFGDVIAQAYTGLGSLPAIERNASAPSSPAAENILPERELPLNGYIRSIVEMNPPQFRKPVEQIYKDMISDFVESSPSDEKLARIVHAAGYLRLNAADQVVVSQQLVRAGMNNPKLLHPLVAYTALSSYIHSGMMFTH